MSITDALKALCQKITGEESTADSIAGVIAGITAGYPEDTSGQEEEETDPSGEG